MRAPHQVRATAAPITTRPRDRASRPRAAPPLASRAAPFAMHSWAPASESRRRRGRPKTAWRRQNLQQAYHPGARTPATSVRTTRRAGPTTRRAPSPRFSIAAPVDRTCRRRRPSGSGATRRSTARLVFLLRHRHQRPPPAGATRRRRADGPTCAQRTLSGAWRACAGRAAAARGPTSPVFIDA